MTSHDVRAGEAGGAARSAEAAGPAGGPRAGQPVRRTYPAEYRARILAEYDAAAPGGKGAIVRREGLYSSCIDKWRKQRDRDAKAAAPAAPRPARPARDRKAGKAEIARLEQANARLSEKLVNTEAALEILGEWVALLEKMSGSADSVTS
jgi:transposase